ncbi:TetR/AcrR family transcriptional regulator [Rhodococcus chondri]|uniref:TetR/AcrR family transcriptional regulator n=1 Tax=Rhodococcus chondri TaxID=3065941 RepID=A0ABU7JVI1_9NOCA|nr:TetR/AcrR family transcriptional regulator [Rhodococcus sp. CC-R104]MEE2033297.1 TetR/AcrR family transcriptional regulator [Rhodococcus sp. CC-R104]
MATHVRREDYFDAAFEILSMNAHGGLKQARLCAHLEVTTGSFYNYFDSWGRFKTEFLQHWLEEQTLQLVATARLEALPVRRLEILIDFACSLPHNAESALRAWAHSDLEVRAVQETVDDRRYEVVLEATSTLAEPEIAARFARLALYTLAGYQQSLPVQDVDSLRWSLHQVLGQLLEGASA